MGTSQRVPKPSGKSQWVIEGLFAPSAELKSKSKVWSHEQSKSWLLLQCAKREETSLKQKENQGCSSPGSEAEHRAAQGTIFTLKLVHPSNEGSQQAPATS